MHVPGGHKKKNKPCKHMYNYLYMHSEGREEKKKKTNKKCMYNYSYTHFQSQKKKNIRNMRTIARTHVLGPGVPEKVDGH
jgi:hypothetical protein